MDRPKVIYGIYILLLVIFMGLVALTPYLAFSDIGAAKSLYSGFAPTCHQKISRSLCLFEGNGTWIGDCTPQNGVYVADSRETISETVSGALGYKFPVCSRDIGIYLFMLLGAIAYPFVFKLDSKEILPPILLILAIVPLAIDGTLQLVSDLGISIGPIHAYESTNLLRLVTGGLAGFAVSFYLIPILNRMFG